MKPGPKPQPLTTRLLARSVRQANGCLLWTGTPNGSGYGSISLTPASVRVCVHRAAYEAWVGPIPVGYHVDHLCRVRLCIEPTHLEAVTPRQNMLRSTSPAAIAAGRPTCKNGHLWTPETTYRTKSGSRVCRTCHREYMRGRYPRPHRRKEEARRLSLAVRT